MIVLIIIAAVLIYFLDGKRLIKNKQWKELGVMSLLLAAAASLELMSMFKIPLPLTWLEFIFRPLGVLIMK